MFLTKGVATGALRLVVVCLAGTAAVLGQQGGGSGRGAVNDESGAGHTATIRYFRVPAFAKAGNRVVLAPGEVHYSGNVQAGADGGYTVGSVPAGTYDLCAVPDDAAYVDGCEWLRHVPAALGGGTLAASIPSLTLVKGVRVTINVDDPGSLLGSESASAGGGMVVGMMEKGGQFHRAQVTVRGAAQRQYAITVPAGQMSVWVYSAGLALAGPDGTAIPPRGKAFPVDLTDGRAVSVTVRVAGKLASPVY